MTIRVSAGSQNFVVKGNQLLTFDGRKIVRYFGLNPEIAAAKVEVLGKSYFEDCKHLEGIRFGSESKLQQIGPSALSGCESLADRRICVNQDRQKCRSSAELMLSIGGREEDASNCNG
jgi:hypothetical protein